MDGNFKMMGEQNQLLFNLNVPYNPMNMVTQFYNPGPVVIERLAGSAKPDTCLGPPKQSLDENSVQFSIISKEKLSFAMQLARRDLKNKIREQQQQHLKQKLEEKDEGLSKSKKAVKKKNTNKKIIRSRIPPTSPQTGRVSINVNKRSVKTQTPQSSKHHKKFADVFNTQKGSPVLVLQSHSQTYSDFERKVRESKPKVKTGSTTPVPAKPASNQQNEEIARLNKELKTCMDRISTLSKQVTESGTVKSPDRAATLRAGLEALIRAERSPPHPVQSSKVKVRLASPRRHRKPITESRPRKPQNRGVILPAKHKHFHSSASTSAEIMHFTRPTESSRSKALAAHEIALKNKRLSPDRTGRPTWAPPGSPKSFHKVSSRRPEAVSSHLESNDVDDLADSEADSLDYERRGGTGRGTPRVERESKDRLMGRHGEGHLGEEEEAKDLTRMTRKVELGRSDDTVHSSMQQKQSNLGRGSNSHSNIDRSMVPEHGGRTKMTSPRGNSRSQAAVSRDVMHKPSVRRKVQFDQPAPTDNSQSSGQQRSDVDFGLKTHLQFKDQVLHGSERTYPMRLDLDDYDQYGDDESYGVSLAREPSGHDGMPSNSQESVKFPGAQHAHSKQSLKNYKDKITDLLVDEVIEDAVQELERLEDDAMVTRQAQMVEAAPTLENMLHDLEMMEIEEERIRRRWKEVKYSDPHTSGSLQGQGSNQSHCDWMKGTPLDAQQMERLHKVPTQHTAMLFTKSRPEETGDTNAFVLHPSTQENRLDDEEEEKEENVNEVAAVGIPARPIVLASSTSHDCPTLNGSKKSIAGGKIPSKCEEDHEIPVFVSSGMMKQVVEGRDAFKTHLKRTSHLPYGTFNPWKLVENISDDLMDEILAGITEEVGDVVGHYVETLYASEFDVKTESPMQDKKNYSRNAATD